MSDMPEMDQKYPTLGDYLNVLLNYRWLLVVLVLFSILCATILSAMMDTYYTAEIAVDLDKIREDSPWRFYFFDEYVQGLEFINSLAEELKSKDPSLQLNPLMIAETIQAKFDGNINKYIIRANLPVERQAKIFAETIAQKTGNYIVTVYEELAAASAQRLNSLQNTKTELSSQLNKLRDRYTPQAWSIEYESLLELKGELLVRLTEDVSSKERQNIEKRLAELQREIEQHKSILSLAEQYSEKLSEWEALLSVISVEQRDYFRFQAYVDQAKLSAKESSNIGTISIKKHTPARLQWGVVIALSGLMVSILIVFLVHFIRQSILVDPR